MIDIQNIKLKLPSNDSIQIVFETHSGSIEFKLSLKKILSNENLNMRFKWLRLYTIKQKLESEDFREHLIILKKNVNIYKIEFLEHIDTTITCRIIYNYMISTILKRADNNKYNGSKDTILLNMMAKYCSDDSYLMERLFDIRNYSMLREKIFGDDFYFNVFLNNKFIALKILSHPNIYNMYNKKIPCKLENDIDCINTACEYGKLNLFNNINELLEDNQIKHMIARSECTSIKQIPKRFRCGYHFIKTAVSADGFNFKFIDPKHLKDRNLVLAGCKSRGCYPGIAKYFRDDFEIILEGIKSCPNMISIASKRLNRNKTIVYNIIINYLNSLRHPVIVPKNIHKLTLIKVLYDIKNTSIVVGSKSKIEKIAKMYKLDIKKIMI
jgi:hypothetical protein